MRFAVMAVPAQGGRRWVQQAAQWEEQGFDVILTPDTLNTPSPFPVLAAAAAATSRIRLRPWVIAAPLRTVAATVREASALQHVSDGRFELGVGTGRPDAQAEASRLGGTWGTGAERRRRVVEVVSGVRREISPAPPICVTATGPAALRMARDVVSAPDAGPQDRIGLALAPTADPEAVGLACDGVRRGLAGDSAGAGDGVRITFQIAGVRGRVSAWLARSTGLTVEGLAGALALLPEDPGLAAAEIASWPGRFGIDEVVVPMDLAEPMLAVMTASSSL